MKNVAIFQWLSLLVFLVAFIAHYGYYAIPFIENPIGLWLMAGATVLAFIFSAGLSWIGLVLFLLGFALENNWMSLNLEGVQIAARWVMLSGFLSVFLSGKK
ncbi:MAG: hypothetical protein OHK0053_36840 [Microscillaceae bacterium]